MNVRFTTDSIRCRLAPAEFTLLNSGRAVELIVALPRNHAFKMNVRPSALNQWQLASDPTGIWITVPASELKSLSETLPNREGIERSFELDAGSILVTVEVDVRKQRKNALATESTKKSE
jgi:hypothetical protein